MDWNKEELEEQIESNIDFWWQKTRFAEGLLAVLKETSDKKCFMNSATSKAREYYDPWIRDELCSFVENLDDC